MSALIPHTFEGCLSDKELVLMLSIKITFTFKIHFDGCVLSLADLYKLTAELLGEGAYAKVQGAVSLQTGKEYAVKVSRE